MNINDFEIEDKTVSTIKESRESLKKLLDCGEFSLEEYNRQINEVAKYDENLMSCWADRVDYSDKFLDNGGILIYEKENSQVVDFLGYC